MSFWDNVKKFTQPYADEEYDDYDEEEYLDDYEEPVEQPTRRAPRRTPAPAPAPAPVAEEEDEDDDYGFTPAVANNAAVSSGFNGRVLNTAGGSKAAIVLFRPTSFNDTSKAADELNAHKAVVVNMENVDKAMARRVVDFLSGCVYSLGGTVKKIAQSAYLFCPRNVEVHGDLESIQAEVESYI